MRDQIKKIRYQEIQDILGGLLDKLEEVEQYVKVHDKDIHQLDDTLKRVASAAGVSDIPFY